MTELWLIRHGETEWNRLRRVQGTLDIALNALGRAQAEQVAARFRPGRDHVHAIYSSDLARAHDTARPTAARLGLDVRLDAGLRERKYGVFEGLSFDELAERHPQAAVAVRERHPDYELDGGESLRQFHQRVVAALGRIAAAHAGERVLVFTHSGVLDTAYRHAEGLSLRAERRHTLHNVSINRLLVDDARWRVDGWGDVAHLEGAGQDAWEEPADAA
ncbi:histidine phosphatase family protein [Pigmentiphaga sp. H8]|uniref:histidine phosphatase family protein n=1 Tax=unclassified Pigmentiphaga TaxID=2626614 RepID=UPI000F5951BD|nr:histidine phosphatase family protein [Pigmentiphaga sp. H8]AZG10434.1 histidine phosphatase family protein [Pigmentiphaga sp. H8]